MSEKLIKDHWAASRIQPVAKLCSVAEVDGFMELISRHDLGLQARAASRDWSPEELARNRKLSLMCDALRRRKELVAQSDPCVCGVHVETGEVLHHRV